jgi:hypothetical protein
MNLGWKLIVSGIIVFLFIYTIWHGDQKLEDNAQLSVILGGVILLCVITIIIGIFNL